MKILIIGPFPPPIDGCSNANKVLLKNIKLRNIRCDAINTNTSIITRDQGSRFSLKKALLFINNYLAAYKIFRCDVVYFTPGQTFYGVLKYAPFILLCLLAGKPYTIHVHGNYLGKQFAKLTGIKRKIFHFLISKAAAGIVITKSLSKNFENLLPGSKVFTADYFVEENLYMRPLAKKNDKLRILYLSNLMSEKGILEVLDALVELNSKNINYEAVVAGSMEAGIQGEVQKRFDMLGSKVNYVGVVTGETKVDKLMEANTFILPTYYTMEGLPFSILEAMATGNIIITTPHAGIPDVVIDGSNGFLIEPKSSRAIAESLEKINADTSEMVNKYSVYNRSYAIKNFTEENYTSQIIDVLHTTAGA
jgi:glycosyltransferase involved in cell wall biosynthesis